MATSSITKNFIVSGVEQVEMFANAIEESYQESLSKRTIPNLKITNGRPQVFTVKETMLKHIKSFLKAQIKHHCTIKAMRWPKEAK